ncbi:unnamed protein product [Bemisia tabaci]|uniref:F-box domain-containing protein n=1 Tax=Bemisia tabaci TaxID=7038 RepID=A0A9P0G0W1_BEMTA|nr:unnamed protein product [Bemisia tabaci]
MTYKRAECLIFVPKPEVCKSSESLELSRRTRATRSPAQKGKSVKGYVLLSSEFIEQHPKLVQLFDKNRLLIVQNRDVPRLPATEEEMDFVSEIFLDDSPSARVYPLSVTTDHEHTRFVRSLICYTTVRLAREVWKASDMRPAVDDSNREAFRRLVSRSFPLGCDDTGSILHLATWRGQEVLFRTILENGECEINGPSELGRTALHLAAINGSTSLVKALLEKGAEVNVYDLDGASPLHYACRHSAKLVQLLLDEGAEVNDESRDKSQDVECRETPLMIAARNGKPEMVQMLLKRGAAVHIKNRRGETALYCTMDVKVQELLLHSGADPNSAGKRSISNAFWYGSSESIKILLDYGAQVDLRRLIKWSYGQNNRTIQLVLEYRFIDPQLLTSQLGRIVSRYRLWQIPSCIGEHVVKVMALHGLTDLRNVDVEEYWDEDVSRIAKFRQNCDAEVASMKKHKFSGTDLSMRDALALSDFHLYRLLKNPTVTRAIGPALITKQYPIYGSILNHHFRKGKHRRWLQREGVKSLKLLSRGFNRLPDEIVEEIVDCLSTVDILKLRRASAGQS